MVWLRISSYKLVLHSRFTRLTRLSPFQSLRSSQPLPENIINTEKHQRVGLFWYSSRKTIHHQLISIEPYILVSSLTGRVSRQLSLLLLHTKQKSLQMSTPIIIKSEFTPSAPLSWIILTAFLVSAEESPYEDPAYEPNLVRVATASESRSRCNSTATCVGRWHVW